MYIKHLAKVFTSFHALIVVIIITITPPSGKRSDSQLMGKTVVQDVLFNCIVVKLLLARHKKLAIVSPSLKKCFVWKHFFLVSLSETRLLSIINTVAHSIMR